MKKNAIKKRNLPKTFIQIVINFLKCTWRRINIKPQETKPELSQTPLAGCSFSFSLLPTRPIHSRERKRREEGERSAICNGNLPLLVLGITDGNNNLILRRLFCDLITRSTLPIHHHSSGTLLWSRVFVCFHSFLSTYVRSYRFSLFCVGMVFCCLIHGGLENSGLGLEFVPVWFLYVDL